MAAKHVLATLALMALVPGCLRLMDEPPEDGAAGFECLRDSECAEGSSCLGLATSFGKGKCGEPGQCESSSQCEALEACMNGQCHQVQCTGDYHEPATVCGLYDCNDATFTCRTACEKDSECSTGNVCRAGSCYANKCTAATAALICQGYACDTVLGKCDQPGIQACRERGCASGYICVDEDSCEKPCDPQKASPQCGDYRCTSRTAGYPSVTYNYCSDSCSAHSDCLNGTVCVDRKCGPKP
jgi:hypothetical protein